MQFAKGIGLAVLTLGRSQAKQDGHPIWDSRRVRS